MTDITGALKIIEGAFEECQRELRFWHRNSKEGVKTSASLEQSEQALTLITAIRDGAPDGLDDSIAEYKEEVINNLHENYWTCENSVHEAATILSNICKED